MEVHHNACCHLPSGAVQRRKTQLKRVRSLASEKSHEFVEMLSEHQFSILAIVVSKWYHPQVKSGNSHAVRRHISC